MKKLLLGTIFSSLSLIVSSQYCTTGGPTSNIDSNLESLNITGEASSISFVGCPGVLGVQEVLSQSVTLNAGGSYTLNLQFGTCGGNYAGVGEAWIDFNNDGVFSTNESIGTWQGMPPTAASVFNFTVPTSAVNGTGRMRVIQYEGGSLPISPCASFSWGSVTDFTVVIQNGIDCTGIIGDDTNTPIEVNSYPYTNTNNSSGCYSNMNLVYNSPDVFYLLTNFAGISSFDISLCGSTFDTYLTVALPNGTIVGSNDDYVNCGSQSQVSIGTYNYDSLFVIVEGWGDNQGEFTLNISEGTLGINQLAMNQFSIHPNPSHDYIQINNDFSGKVEIYNTKGEMVLNKEIQVLEKIDVHDFEKGIYYVKCLSDNKSIVNKLIIN